jgi:hypothetical protein
MREIMKKVKEIKNKMRKILKYLVFMCRIVAESGKGIILGELEIQTPH